MQSTVADRRAICLLFIALVFKTKSISAVNSESINQPSTPFYFSEQTDEHRSRQQN